MHVFARLDYAHACVHGACVCDCARVWACVRHARMCLYAGMQVDRKVCVLPCILCLCMCVRAGMCAHTDRQIASWLAS